MKIAVVAPSNPVPPDVPDRVAPLVPAGVELVFHPQCFLSEGHFAGPDRAREDAFVEMANDPSVDRIWFGRGGYGANRIAERAADRLDATGRGKTFMGYSDGGFLLAALDQLGCRVLHGPMPGDIRRQGGEAAVARALAGLLDAPTASRPQLAFNLTVLSALLGTPLEPDFAGRVLMVEEVDEHHYRLDRLLFHVTSSANVRGCAGLMLGRCDPIPVNDVAFDADEETIASYWCARAGIPYLGRADIGHDADNKVVPFG